MRPGAELISSLGLSPHPEGGWYRRTWVAESVGNERPIGSAILYLLLAGEVSAPHRIDVTEIWHYYGGDPLELSTERADGTVVVHTMGHDIGAGQVPQVVVPPGTWQSARPLGRYALMGATVTPAFTFEGFELRDGPARPD